MNYSFKFLLLLLLQFTQSIFVLYTRKCPHDNNFMISYLRYQYDMKHYPQFCKYDNLLDLREIDYMFYNFDIDMNICKHELLLDDNLPEDHKKYKYIENIWYNYGSCTKLEPYYYFNYTFRLFYKYHSKFKNCHEIQKNCKYIFNDNLLEYI